MGEKKGSKIEFMRDFPWPKGFGWIGDEGFVKLSDGRLAKVELTIRACDWMPVQDHWNGFEVHIIDSNKGKIDHKYFPWRDYLKSTGTYHEGDLSVYGGGDWTWYINRPTEVKPIVTAIMKYILLFDPKRWVHPEGEEE